MIQDTIFKFQFKFQSDFTIKLFKVYGCPHPTPRPHHPSLLSLQARGPHHSLCSYKMEKNEFSIIDRHDAYRAIFNIELDCPYFSYRAASGLWAFFLPLLRSLLDLPSVSHSAAGLLTGCESLSCWLIPVEQMDSLWVHGHGLVVCSEESLQMSVLF